MKKTEWKQFPYYDFEDLLEGAIKLKKGTTRAHVFDYWHDEDIGEGAAGTTAVEMRINGHQKVLGPEEIAKWVGCDRIRFTEEGVLLGWDRKAEEPKSVVMTDAEILAARKPAEDPAEPPKPAPAPETERRTVVVVEFTYDPDPLHQFMRHLKRMLFR